MRVCFIFICAHTFNMKQYEHSHGGFVSVFLYPLAAFVSSLLAHGKGAAFFVLPNTGTLGPFETQTVEVTLYSDMWGEYRDRLICRVWILWLEIKHVSSWFSHRQIHLNLSLAVFLPQVGDLEPTLIPMQMTVKGCPLYFQMTGPHPDDQNQGPIIQSVSISISPSLHWMFYYSTALKKRLQTFRQ